MELKPGYKRTDVGLIPDEWQVKRVGDLGTVVRGGSPRPAGHPKYFNGTFIPWLTVAALTNIPDSQLRVTKTAGYLTEEGATHSRTLITGTLIIANSGATLGVAKLLQVTCCANDGIAAIINQKLGDKEFICHWINSMTSHLREVVATGNGQPNLNTALIQEIRVPFPPEPEQHVIAAALGDVDALIAALDRLIAKKRDLRQAAMQQLLTGQTRLPGFSGARESRELRSFVRGFLVPMRDKPRRFSGDIPWCRIEDFDGKYLTRSRSGQHVDQQTVKEMNLKVFPIGTLLVSCSADLGRCAIVGRPLVTNQTFIGLVLDETVSSNEFMYYYMSYKAEELNTLSSGTTISYLSREQFEGLPVSIPSTKGEQSAIAAVLADMDTELAALEQRLAKTRALKQGMMQELLSGRTRLV